jgi:hypothetical protein
LLAAACCAVASAQVPAFGDDRVRLPGRSGPATAQALADVDGDGLIDVLRATGRRLEVLRQTGSGAFADVQGALPLALPAGATVVSIATGRFAPGTLPPDLVVGVSGGDSLVFDNDGTGLFAPRVPSPLPRPSGFSGATTQVLVGDVDGNTTDDVVVLHDSAAPQVFLQALTGAFLEQGQQFFPPGFFPQSPVGVLADLDGSGLPDLVVVRRGVAALPILMSNAGGTSFLVQANAFAGVTPWAATGIRAGDATRDGVTDLLLVSSLPGGGLRVLGNTGAGAFTDVPLPALSVAPMLDVAVGRLDADPDADLALLRGDGSVGVVFAQGGGFGAPVELLPAASRRALEAADLETDGDLDLYVAGAVSEDELLLGAGAGAFAATESITAPIGLLADPHHLALFDATGEGDPDIVGYAGAGAPVALANDGAARFHPAPNLLPSLRLATVLAVTPMTLQPGTTALAVLGTSITTGRGGVYLLVSQGGVMVEQTNPRFPIVLHDLAAFAVGDVVTGAPGTLGCDDIVAVDTSGDLHLFRSQSGVFTELAAFGGANVTAAARVLLGRVNGDAALDVVVVRQTGAPQVFLQLGAGQFQAAPQTAGSYPSKRGLLTDVTGDGIADLLLVASQGPVPLFFLVGAGDGAFVDGTGLAPAPLPPNLASVTALGGSDTQQPDALIFGSRTEADVAFHRQGGSFSLRTTLPERGSQDTDAVLAGDLDLDGDRDLVVCRNGALPRVMLEQSFQLVAGGLTQVGRHSVISLRVPEPGAAAVFIGVQTARLPFAFGVLRLDPSLILQLLSLPVAPPGFDLDVPTASTWPVFDLPLQTGFVNNAGTRVVLGNLEFWSLTDY